MTAKKTSKTDNHNPKAKLDLRRYFLNKYHASEPPRVFDCCQGGGVMWGTLQEEFLVANYWGVDLKQKKGRLKIDSIRILQQGIGEDVIDIDTYGSPWKHWFAVIANFKNATTVFLTIGNQNTTAMSPGSHGDKLIESFPPSTPDFLKAKYLRENDVILGLAKASQFATITEAIEAVSTGNARYIGVRLEPINKNSLPTVDAASKPKQSKAVRSNANV